jgi:alanyl-tRNA synthetase
VAKELKAPQAALVDRIRQLEREIAQAKESKAKNPTIDRDGALAGIRAALGPIPDGVGASVVLAGFPATDLRSLVDELKKDVPNFALALIVPEESQVSFVVAAHGAPGKRLKAGDIAKAIGPALGGGGGGRPDFAQGQGKNPAGADAAAKQAQALFAG